MTESGTEERVNFNTAYSDNLPAILSALNISLAVTSYQASRLILIRSNGKELHTWSKAFPRPMGIYADRERITLGTFTQVIDFRRSDELLHRIRAGQLDGDVSFSRKVLEKDEEALANLMQERKAVIDEVKQADTLYLHRAALTTGMINIHDIAWGDEGLWVVNSAFSCLATLSPQKSFVARWKPPFISELVPEDRCHLNGMALRDGCPRYVTTFNKENRCDSWAQGERVHDGTLIDVKTNEILLEGMYMPHSPRYHDGMVYVCESGRGIVWRLDPETGVRSQVIKLPGFLRGLTFLGDLMLVGLSKIREGNNSGEMPLRNDYKETFSGIWLINLNDNRVVAYIRFEDEVEQVYDIAVIPDSSCPDLVNVDSPLTRHLFDYTEDLI